jgi:endo-1,4-beta-xylanase
MKVRGHTLVWGWSNSPWLLEGHFTSAQLSTMLQEHIQKVVTHYRGQVFAWDVVNEAFEEHGNLKDSVWYNRPGIGLAGKGTAYLEQVFQWAHAADPAALLCYNDAEGETLNAKSDAIYAMVKDFKRRRVPIDGVGLQMHLFDLNPDLASIEATIARFTALGVQVHITEMDVALPTVPNGEASKQQIWRGKARSTAASPGHVCPIPAAPLSKPGVSPTSTPGFVPRQRGQKEQRSYLIAITRRSPPASP